MVMVDQVLIFHMEVIRTMDMKSNSPLDHHRADTLELDTRDNREGGSLTMI